MYNPLSPLCIQFHGLPKHTLRSHADEGKDMGDSFSEFPLDRSQILDLTINKWLAQYKTSGKPAWVAGRKRWIIFAHCEG